MPVSTTVMRSGPPLLPHLASLTLLLAAFAGVGCGSGAAPERAPIEPPSIQAVLRDLASEDYDTHIAALESLWKHGAEAVPHLAAVLTSSQDEEERIIAIQGLAALHTVAESAVPELIEALRGPGRFACYEAHGAIGLFGEPAARALVSELARDAGRATAAANALGSFAAYADIAVPGLVHALDHEDKVVRYVAAFSLKRYGELAALAVPRLIALLSDDDLSVSSTAGECLACVGAKAVPALTEALGSRELWQRVWSAKALGEIGSPARTAVPALLRLLDDPFSGVQSASATALGSILTAEESVPILVTALGSPEEGVRGRAAEALGRLGEGATAATPMLRVTMTSGGWYGRLRAAHAVAQIDAASEDAVSVLTAGLASPEWMDHSEAANMLGSLGALARPALPALKEYVKAGGVGLALISVKDAIRDIENAPALK